MSLTYKTLARLGVTLTLTITCVVGVTAQARVVADSSSNSEPKKAETASPSIGISRNSTHDKISETSRDADDPRTATVVNAPTSVTRTTSEVSSPAPQPTTDDEWHFIFSPYFWMAGLHGTTGTPARIVEVDQSFSDIFGSLNFAFMGLFEARKGKWLVLTDVEFVSLEDDRATPGPLFSAVNAKIKMFNFKPELGYRIFADAEKGNFIDVVGGARIWYISTDLTFSPGILSAAQIDASRSWVDAVAGLRGKASLSEKVFTIGKLDLGGGGSKFTYQLFGGLGYNLNRKIALIGGYRVLDVNYDKNNFVYDMNQRGPIIGAAFRF